MAAPPLATTGRVLPREAEHPEEEDFEELENFDDAVEAWEERWEPVMWSADRTVGAVVISTLGCAAREWLIISGPERGRIWSDNRVDDEDLKPLLDGNGAPVIFTRWYLAWFEKAERHLASVPATDRVGAGGVRPGLLGPAVGVGAG
ncbi:hypothetical protein [Streptomyces pratensis]|uniref:hypothetical protein n=1 Tax=Streptomyces pratensis TaxID=1169025 RepID=UPI0019345D39|nr:hypothetical protein [Streptomyces pratensis]